MAFQDYIEVRLIDLNNGMTGIRHLMIYCISNAYGARLQISFERP